MGVDDIMGGGETAEFVSTVRNEGGSRTCSKMEQVRNGGMDDGF